MSFLQIASWNIEHLSGVGQREKVQSAYALADHMEMAGIDIIALQEIYVTHADDEHGPRNAELDRVCDLLEEHLEEPWEYKIYPNRDADDTSQLCAVMWNTGRVRKSGELKIPVKHKQDGHDLWDRAPHAVKFTMLMKVWRKDASGEWHQEDEDRSIIIIPVHMKSNYGGPTKSRVTRGKEADALCAEIPRVRRELADESIIVIGDTNVLKYDEPAIEAFLSHGFIDLNNTDAGTYWSREFGDSPFDRAFVTAGRPEFKYSRQYVLRSSDLVLHDRFLSDHQMIKVSVKLYLDDTDPRDSSTA